MFSAGIEPGALRITNLDNAKESQSEEMVDYGAEKHIMLQLVAPTALWVPLAASSSTAEHLCSMLHAGKPNDATKNSWIKKVFI